MLISKNTQESSDSSHIFKKIHRTCLGALRRFKKIIETKKPYKGALRTPLFKAVFVKLAVLFVVFLFGVVGTISPDAINSIAPISAATEEEVLANKNIQKQYTTNNTSRAFLSAQNNSFSDTKELRGTEYAVENIDSFSLNSRSLFLADMNTPFEVEQVVSESKESPETNKGGNEIIEYKVESGDSVAKIASKFEVSIETILWSNDIGNPDLVSPGDTLLILPEDGVIHEVRDGETLGGIVSRHEASKEKTISYNNLDSSGTIFPGQRLILPGGKKPSTEPSQPQQRSRIAQQPQQQTHTSFIRPTSGRISQGLHPTNAVDISNNCGTPIRAAAGGTVSTVGATGAWGYGNYVRISHPNGTRTLYAHLQHGGVYVRTGQQVSQGQTIGSMGATGTATGCHLHFEVHGARNFIL